MLNAFSTVILTSALEQKTKAGKFKMSDVNRKFIQDFFKFDLDTDWMEAKDHTKMGRALAAAVLTGCAIENEPLRDENNKGVCLYNNITFLTVQHQDWHCKGDREAILHRVELLEPIQQKWEAMRERLTKNGKFPKEEAERRRREEIKGSLDKKLSAALTVIKEEWYEIVYNNEIEVMGKMVTFITPYLQTWNESGVSKDNQRWVAGYVMRGVLMVHENNFSKKKVYSTATKSQIEAAAKRIARNESEAFFFKMADKLGGLVTGKRALISASSGANLSGRDPFSSYIAFTFENNTSFFLENKIIINRSPLHNEFYQYPCTFHNLVIDGNKISGSLSEFVVKRAFNQ